MGTATPSETFVVKQIFDVGQAIAVRSLLFSDVVNDCAVEVHVYKINGWCLCALVANKKIISGDEREFIFETTRFNGMWWISEEQMSDIVSSR